MRAKSDRRLNPQVHAEATEWLIRFVEDEVDHEGRGAFSAWLKHSPEHIDAYLHLVAFWREAGLLTAGKDKVDIDQLVMLARQEANVVPLGVRDGVGPRDRSKSMQARPSSLARWAMAVSAVVIVLGALIYWIPARDAYTTGTGEQRTVNLDDGSTVTINAKSSIRVSYNKQQRLIELREGQALFKVAANSARPFIVSAGPSTIQALGTQFDVYRKQADVVVTVVEGRVAVTPQKTDAAQVSTAPEVLAAGEQAVVTAKATHKSRPAHVEAVTAWTDGLLVFDKTPLREVVAQFNRQNSRPLVLADDTLQDVEISAVFPASGSDRIVKFLQDRLGVSVSEDQDGIHIGRPVTAP